MAAQLSVTQLGRVRFPGSTQVFMSGYPRGQMARSAKSLFVSSNLTPDVSVLYEKDLDPVLKYVRNKYGKDFINLYE